MKNTEPDTLSQSLYKGLQALSDLSFPKICATCGIRYDTVEDFISKTQELRKSTGLKEERDDEDQIIVELFRNCTCGSTLMDEFNNRRDLSEAGLKRREKFEQILERLMAAGHAREVARQELLNIMRGQGSRLLKVKSEADRGRPEGINP